MHKMVKSQEDSTLHLFLHVNYSYIWYTICHFLLQIPSITITYVVIV